MEQITIDLIPNGKMPMLHASQYDDGRQVRINLTENRQPYTLTGNEVLPLSVRKADNTLVTLDIANVYGGKSYVEFATTKQMCACAGMGYGELRIKEADKDIGTLNFTMWTEQSPEEGGVRSDSEINNLARQVNEMVDAEMGDYYNKTEADEKFATNTDLQTLSGVVDTKASQTDLTALAGVVDGKANTTDVNNALANKMNKANPTGTGSMSVGSGITMFGSNSQAFGSNHVVGGSDNFVAGVGHSIVYGSNRFVFGSYSKGDVSYDIIEVVGNGTSGSNRSNARTLDKNGNETLAGDLTYNGNKSLTSEISRLDGRIDNLPAPMVFKGTLGTGGTIEVLPVASDYNEGWTYKVITDGTYAGQTAKVGDVFTSNGSAWVYIPSGDEDNDTWRAIKVNGVEKLGNGISSGSLDVVDTDNIEVEFDADGNKLKIKTKNIYTQSEVDTLIANAIDSVLPTDSVSGAVANFKTSLTKKLVSVDVDNSATKIYQFGFNLFDKATTIDGAYISDTDGSQKAATGSKCTDYIPIVGDTEFYIRTDQTQGAWGAFYDENKVFISAWTGYTPVGTYKAKTSPANARFARFTIVRNNSGDENTFCFSVSGSDNGQYEAYNPNSDVYLVADKDDITTLAGYNTIFADNGDIDVSFKCSVEDYVNAHSGGGLRSLGNSNENLSKGGDDTGDEPKGDEKEPIEPISKK